MARGSYYYYKAKILIAKLIESLNQVVCDHLSGPAFYLVPLNEMNQVSVLKQCNGG